MISAMNAAIDDQPEAEQRPEAASEQPEHAADHLPDIQLPLHRGYVSAVTSAAFRTRGGYRSAAGQISWKSQILQAENEGFGSKFWARMPSATSVAVCVIRSTSSALGSSGTTSSSST